ncbi:hypothetical protein BV22DRAFT_1132978 [Leucogyrophana mollusca]|uniref:Uncharacterized protein n=1 Tax=Leucogyrophana mollusca TaxID=85980 RepID=A0ACB8B4I6_9AGAM|nr:hypothetical protein BV22DRAFT_1132978 [Leucogyrophana mollusca]
MATIEFAVQSMYYNNCFSVAVATLLVYDYLLTIGQEDEYVWVGHPCLLDLCPISNNLIAKANVSHVIPLLCSSYSFAILASSSASLGPYGGVLFVGLYQGMSSISVLCSTRFDTRGFDIGIGFYLFFEVGFYAIIWASAAIVSLRVCAMYSQSKIIMGMLLLFFVPTIVGTIVLVAKFYDISSAKADVTALDLLGTNYCTQALLPTPLLLPVYLTIPRVCFDVLLVVLAVGRLVKDAVDNRVLGKWQPNVYLRMLARDSIMYFLLNLAFTLIEITQPFSTWSIWAQYTGLAIVDTVPFMVAPHLIISFRYHTKADAIHSGFASQLGTSLGAGEQEMCFARPALTSSMDERGV